jgi:predicted Zn-dependent peptidase
MFRLTLGALIALALAASAATAADVGVYTLPNGVTVLTMPAEWNRIVAVSAMVDAGTKYDPPGMSGLAYVTATALTQGTTDRTASELAEFVDSSGLELGAEVTYDYAHVYVTMIDSELDAGLEVLADVLQNPAFDKRHVLDVQRQANDRLDSLESLDPFFTPFYRMAELLFDDHPYARPVEGTEAGIDRITVADLVKYHRSRYVGGSTVISIVGDFEPEATVKQLAGLLSDYPEGTAQGPAPLPPPPAQAATMKLYADVETAHISMGFAAPSTRDDDEAAMAVLSGLMGLGSGSRLRRELGPDGADLVTSVRAFCSCREEASAFVILASTDSPDETEEALLKQLDLLTTEPVPSRELAEARNRVIGNHVISGQTNLARARRLGASELIGRGYAHAEAFLEEVNRVDRDDIMRVASEWLRKPVTVIVYPGKTTIPRSVRVRAGI